MFLDLLHPSCCGLVRSCSKDLGRGSFDVETEKRWRGLKRDCYRRLQRCEMKEDCPMLSILLSSKFKMLMLVEKRKIWEELEPGSMLSGRKIIGRIGRKIGTIGKLGRKIGKIGRNRYRQ